MSVDLKWRRLTNKFLFVFFLFQQFAVYKSHSQQYLDFGTVYILLPRIRLMYWEEETRL